MNTQRKEILKAIIRNSEQALCGPLGYHQREEVRARAAEAKEHLSEHNRDVYEADNPNHNY